MENNFSIYGSNTAVVDYLKSSIKSSEKVIAHYDFVLRDISSTISDPKLESTKAPVVAFLKEMKKVWEDFQTKLKLDLKELEREQNDSSKE